MEIKDILKNRRTELGLTQLDVANAVGVSEATVSRWESGDIANMKRSRIASLASVLKMSPSIIMGWNEEHEAHMPSNIIPMPAMRKVPLVGSIACGTPILAEENLDGTVEAPDHVRADFALRCKGDSMINARIFDGDIVYIRQQESVEHGEIAAVLIETDATLKRVFLFKDHIELRAENPSFPSIVLIGEDMNQVIIEGKAVGLCRDL